MESNMLDTQSAASGPPVVYFYAEVQSGIVTAVSQLAGPVDAAHMIAIDSYDSSLLGKIHNGETGEFYDAPPDPDYVPYSVSSRQGQLALLDAGYLDDVEMMIASIPDDSERRRAQIEFGATMWERSNPFLQQMWAGLGGDSDGLDDLFRAAIKL